MVAILTVLFGWAGYYRFHKGQIGLGVLYLLTGGIFCIGWFYDIYLSAKEMFAEAKTNIKKKMEEQGEDIVNSGLAEYPDINDIFSPFVTKSHAFSITDAAIIIDEEVFPFEECGNIRVVSGEMWTGTYGYAKFKYKGTDRKLEYEQADRHRAPHAFEYANNKIFAAHGHPVPLFSFITHHGSELLVYDDYISIRFVRPTRGAFSYAAKVFDDGTNGVKQIYIADITAIQHKESRDCVTDGVIQFAYAGSIEQNGLISERTNDENSIVYSYYRLDDACAIVEYINNRRMELRRQQTIVTQHTTTSVPDELRKYKELLDQGIITQEEFEAKKKELLTL